MLKTNRIVYISLNLSCKVAQHDVRRFFNHINHLSSTANDFNYLSINVYGFAHTVRRASRVGVGSCMGTGDRVRRTSCVGVGLCAWPCVRRTMCGQASTTCADLWERYTDDLRTCRFPGFWGARYYGL